MANPLYDRKLLLTSLPWISDVQVYTGNYAVYYVVKGREGEPGEDHLRQARELLEPHRYMGLRVDVVTRVPRDATHRFEVPRELERNIEASNPTRQGILDALNQIFPEASFTEIEDDHGRRAFTLVQAAGSKAIGPEAAAEAIRMIHPGVPWTVNVVTAAGPADQPAASTPEPQPVARHGLELVLSGSLGHSPLRRLTECDEEFLSANHDAAMRGHLAFNNEGASIFVDSFPGERQDVRPLLAVFDKVIITPRIGDKASFDLSDEEILSAVAAGRIKLACKRDVSFYKDPLLTRVIETDMAAVLGPRQLGLYMAAEQIRRNPLLESLATDFDETRVFLELLKQAIAEADVEHPHLHNLLIDDTIASFIDISRGVSNIGPSFALRNGYGALAAKLYALANPTAQTPDIELWGVGESMQAGLALKSYILRSHGSFYHPHYEYIARLVSAKPRDINTLADIDKILAGLYIPTLEGMPIDAYLKIFDEESNQKVRTLLLEILRNTTSLEEVRSKVACVNLESSLVRGARSNRAKLDALGFGLSFVSFSASWMGWLAQRGIAAGAPVIERKFATVGDLRQTLEAKMLGTSVQAVQLADIQSSIDERHGQFVRALVRSTVAGARGWLGRRIGPGGTR